MTILALSAPSSFLAASPGGGTISGLILPASEATSITGSPTAITVPNNGAVLVRIVVAVSGTGTIQFIEQKSIAGATLAATQFQQTLSNSTVYVFGPFAPSQFNDVNGLLNMQGTLLAASGNTIGVYSVPGFLS